MAFPLTKSLLGRFILKADLRRDLELFIENLETRLNNEGTVTQTDWAVNSTTGNDSAPGTAAAPLKTLSELARRFNGSTTTTSGQTTVRLYGEFPEQDLTIFDLQAGHNLVFIGETPTVLATGTCTGAVGFNQIGTEPTFSDSGLAGGFAPYINRMVRITSGPRAGATFFIAKENSPGVARTSRCGNYVIGTSTSAVNVTPLAGDPYEILKLQEIGRVRVQTEFVGPFASGQFQIRAPVWLDMLQPTDVLPFYTTMAGFSFSAFNAALTLVRCDLKGDASDPSAFGSSIQMGGAGLIKAFLSRFGGGLSMRGPVLEMEHCLINKYFFSQNSAVIMRSTVLQTGYIFVYEKAFLEHRNGLAIFDNPISQPTILVTRGGVLTSGSSVTSQRIFGTGNTLGPGIRVGTGSQVHYTASAPPTVGPGTVDWQVTGVTGAYAALPVTSQITTHMAGIVPSVDT